jgi:phosphatidate phosphatase APP1
MPQTRPSIAADEHVVLFATVARADGDDWVVPLHGWLFEPEEDSLRRGALIRVLLSSLPLSADEAESATFSRRARAFLVDNERGRHVHVRLGTREFALGPTAENGHGTGEARLPAEEAAHLAAAGWVEIQVALGDDDERQFRGRALLLGERGASIVSDVDDTIKITEVRDRRRMLRRTFLEPFEAVPGMADLYRRWATEGASLHFVSAGPWQLYPALAEFVAEAGFPAGTLHMRNVRLKDSSALELLAGPDEYKTETIGGLLRTFPHRRYLLVGDSGERDPEIYGGLARTFPDQVSSILIRNVTDQSADDPRYRDAFRGVPRERWRIFDDAAELADVELPPP